ncbi:MAG TPA: DUF4252 domain-containing protein [Chitinophaga sp.]
MKHKLLQLSIAAGLGLLIALPAQAQRKSLRAFCREYQGQAEIHTFAVGRPLLALASWVIPAKDEDSRVAKHLLHRLRHLKLYTLTVDPDARVQDGAMERLKTRLEAEHFESLADIRSKDAIVHVMSSGRPENLGNVVLMVKDEEDIVFISLRTRLTLKDVADVVNQYALSDLHKDKDHQQKAEKQPVEHKVVADHASTVAQN